MAGINESSLYEYGKKNIIKSSQAIYLLYDMQYTCA